MKKWKDKCDICDSYKEGCHGYEGKILCPSCAKKLGYKLWKKENKDVRKER